MDPRIAQVTAITKIGDSVYSVSSQELLHRSEGDLVLVNIEFEEWVARRELLLFAALRGYEQLIEVGNFISWLE